MKAGRVANMGSWLGWLLILAVVYLVVVVVRGIIQFTSWFIEEFFPDSWSQEPSGKESKQHRREMSSVAMSVSGSPQKKKDCRDSYARWILVSAARIALLHWLAALAEFSRMLVSSRKYDYWVGSALAEDDARKKVKYLSKALALNPGYMPGWGLKANALLTLERYEEAMECCERILKTNPNPLAWHEKGLCCYHLGRYQEAVDCFGKTLARCSDQNGKLREDTLRSRKLAKEKIDRKEMA
jgi:tetratricopeptide (TPR) repeat protein